MQQNITFSYRKDLKLYFLTAEISLYFNDVFYFRILV